MSQHNNKAMILFKTFKDTKMDQDVNNLMDIPILELKMELKKTRMEMITKIELVRQEDTLKILKERK